MGSECLQNSVLGFGAHSKGVRFDTIYRAWTQLLVGQTKVFFMTLLPLRETMKTTEYMKCLNATSTAISIPVIPAAPTEVLRASLDILVQFKCPSDDMSAGLSDHAGGFI